MMSRFTRFARKPKTGLYHYRATGEWEGLRLHLRVEADGDGVLIVNASRVLFLNRTATEHIRLFMEGRTEDEVVRAIRRRYRVDAETALNDYRDVLFVVNTFAKTSDVCPISYLGVEKTEPFQRPLSAPYRMDLAVTYRCDNQCVHCYTGGPRETAELTTSEWRRAIDRIFDAGIPHCVFTGGEPTLREDLPQLIRYVEDKGLVSGLVTNGRRLRDPRYVETLVRAGIDHIQVTVESHDAAIHDRITGVAGSWKETVAGLKNAIATPVYTITNTTLNRYNVADILQTVRFLHDLGVEDFACNGLIYAGKGARVADTFSLDERELEPLLREVHEYAQSLGMDVVWYTPTQYCVFNPLEFELGIKSCTACRISMCVEPTGDVIPCQSYFMRLGNILVDEWTAIWNHPLCRELRSRKYAPSKCEDCPQLDVCGAGCPLKLREEG